MTGGDQFERLIRWNRELAAQNRRLQKQLCHAEYELAELRGTNVDLRVERDATDVLLGEAMDRLLEGSQR
jgi:hypothetical protein